MQTNLHYKTNRTQIPNYDDLFVSQTDSFFSSGVVLQERLYTAVTREASICDQVEKLHERFEKKTD